MLVNLDTKRTKSPLFKKSLTSNEVNKVKEMGTYGYEKVINKMRSKYNISADVRGSNTVAFCLESVADIMHRAGFKLPKNFKFEPLRDGILGLYRPATDTVSVNSNKKAFYDLYEQNRLEESNIGYHPKTGHFLQTYLHEFSHAAHYKHLCDVHGNTEGDRIFWGILSEKTPSEFIIGPLNNIFKNCIEAFKITQEEIDKILPRRDGLYSLNDLTEYFAELNSRSLAEKLGPYNNISSVPENFASSYKGHPSSNNLFDQAEEELLQMSICNENMSPDLRILELGRNYLASGNIFKNRTPYTMGSFLEGIVDNCKKEIDYINGEIWNGNIDWLKYKFLK